MFTMDWARLARKHDCETLETVQSTSESLLARLNREDGRDAWPRFVQLYTPLIFYWARKSGLQTHDAADLVQDVLAIVFRKLPQFQYDQSKSFRGWLRTITLNRYRELGRRRRLPFVDASQSSLNGIAQISQAESTWDLNYARQLTASALRSMQKDFSPKTWGALKRLLETGAPAAQIARQSGVSVWTIYAAKARLMQRLRSELDGLL